jgi:solute carrier family 10 (sodium/bile acid cotransporter), member 7
MLPALARSTSSARLGRGRARQFGTKPLRFFDPLVRMILAAIVLATVVPVVGPLRDAAQFVANAAVFLLFLIYGLRLSRAEVLAGLGNHRMLVPLVIWVFGAMTFGGWALWRGGGSLIPADLALGFLYLGVLPSTVQSATAYSSQAGGNVASSVVAAALVNIVGVFVSAPLFAVLAGSGAGVLHTEALVRIGTTLLLPFILGQALQGWFGVWVRARRDLTSVMDRSAIAIAVYVAFSGAVEQGIWSRIDLSAWGVMLAGCGLMLILGYGGAWLLGGALRLPRGDRIALLFAGAQKSIALGAPLATVLFPPAAVGVVLLPLLIYHLAQMIVAAPIALRLRSRSPDL